MPLSPVSDIVILAAGKSERMGSDKALLPVGDRPSIIRMIEKFAELRFSVVVVTGSNHTNIAGALAAYTPASGLSVEIACNDNPGKGMFSSIQAGIRKTSGKRPCFIQMVDQPFVPPEVYRMMLGSLTPARWVVQPVIYRYGEIVGGHPILISATLADKLVKFPDDITFREAMDSFRERTYQMTTDFVEVLRNINTPEEWEKAVREQSMRHYQGHAL